MQREFHSAPSHLAAFCIPTSLRVLLVVLPLLISVSAPEGTKAGDHDAAFDCSCRCACEAQGFDCRAVDCFYSTDAVDGGGSCARPLHGGCVCRSRPPGNTCVRTLLGEAPPPCATRCPASTSAPPPTRTSLARETPRMEATRTATATRTPTAPSPKAGTCCGQKTTAGCADPVCEACVCDKDAFCCKDEWDDFCAEDAARLCREACQCGG